MRQTKQAEKKRRKKAIYRRVKVVSRERGGSK